MIPEKLWENIKINSNMGDFTLNTDLYDKYNASITLEILKKILEKWFKETPY